MSNNLYEIYCTEQVITFNRCYTSNSYEDVTDKVIENLKNFYGLTDDQINVEEDENGKLLTINL
jgi:hypothetical protein